MVIEFRSNNLRLFIIDLFVFIHVFVASLVVSNSLGCNPSLSVQEFNISNSLNGFNNSSFGFLGFKNLDFNSILDFLSSMDMTLNLCFPFNDRSLLS